jgi:hypothetical protein
MRVLKSAGTAQVEVFFCALRSGNGGTNGAAGVSFPPPFSIRDSRFTERHVAFSHPSYLQ